MRMKKIAIALAAITSTAAHAYECNGSFNNIKQHGYDVSGYEIEIYEGGATLVTSTGASGYQEIIQTEITNVEYLGNNMMFRAWKQNFVATCTPQGITLKGEATPRQSLSKGSWVIKKGVVPEFRD